MDLDLDLDLELDLNKNDSNHPNFALTVIESVDKLKKFREKGHGSWNQKEEVEERNETIDTHKIGDRQEILFDGHYYDVTDFIDRHPGGDIIKYYTEKGEDATLPIGQFHFRSSKKVTAIMNSFKKRPAPLPNQAEFAALGLDEETQKRHAALTQDFNKLFMELQAEGLFQPSLVHVALRIVECLFLGFFALFLLTRDSIICTMLGTFMLAVLTPRAGWLMHEGGHHSLTGWPPLDRFIQAGAFGIAAGLSSSWFTDVHSRHHAMPQRFQKDADLETLPLLAFNKKSIQPHHGRLGEGFFIQNQATLFVALDTFLIGLYWKLYLHPKYALKHGKYEQLFFMSLHYTYCYFIGIWPFIIAAWLGSAFLIGNISLSHLHLPLANGRLHWVEYALVHTTDIEPSWWCDWWMGFLNYQIEHHLFPTMPQYKNKRITGRVKALAAKHGIPYYSCSYWEAVVNCYKNLDHVAKELRDDYGDAEGKKME